LSTVSQKLIEAHEEERTRIARELHDDINQRLALLSVNLDCLKADLPSSRFDVNQALDEANNQLCEIASDVQALSHRLHSSKLEHLGLPRAAKGFCRELADRQKVEIDFHAENVPGELPRDIALCLFRVLQEALQNAIKHSGSKHFQVSLTGGTTELELTVRDDGKGFDPEEAFKGRGIGLTSMRERLKLVDGCILIDSQLQHGTKIQARVPLHPAMKAVTAAEE
jgi:signal transduction histidine kinase